MPIYYEDQTETLLDDHITLVKKVIQFALEKENYPDAEVSITFVNNDDIQEINRDYRGQDRPTDVISFALEEISEDEVVLQGKDIPVVLGDIIISVQRTEEQAKEYNHSFERELAFLAVHGLLHLLGYDHQTKEEEKQMFSKQEDILGEFHLER
ncbi:rRNA maturation RNase YbeY [Virgibacillus soli]|uniref:Endoribonuclease YbeY n=1 Tax=Paracerasibacillus soli TaxID=480284 RepID=A0ABU5CST3_9BACI|nr:rRNA maturation RNase YbeY [Virgibacillus soli]MDY0408473.1 rRNA maturation RNase YbeY [Virgibacillus soli]